MTATRAGSGNPKFTVTGVRIVLQLMYLLQTMFYVSAQCTAACIFTSCLCVYHRHRCVDAAVARLLLLALLYSSVLCAVLWVHISCVNSQEYDTTSKAYFRFHNLCKQPAYASKSQEEIRLEDYATAGKGISVLCVSVYGVCVYACMYV